MLTLTPFSGDNYHFLTGAADNTAIIWDTEMGKKLSEINTASAVRTCNFSFSSREFMLSTDAAMGKMCEIQFFDLQQCLSKYRIPCFPRACCKTLKCFWNWRIVPKQQINSCDV